MKYSKKYEETKRLIRQAMNEGQLVLFVGSGTSKDAGMPSWTEAVDRIWDAVGAESDKPDNLLIPQYYYNQRGKKEYTQLMRDIFKYDKNLSPQSIHEKIIDFNTNTIITTNYDNLIEQAAEKQGVFLQVISQDKDLPYRKAGKELVKIHGDFDHDNFVLKEDDYLHYHYNFKLIENYIKSIIGTKTVLFMGYSLSDPDVKQIFAWVKEILSDEFQNAYLIEAGKLYDENEAEYYKHLGVNLIYASELLGADFSKTKKSDNLLGVVDYILGEEKTNIDYFELLLNKLTPYQPLNYIYNLYLRILFNDSVFRMMSVQNESLVFNLRLCDDDPVANQFLDDIKAYLQNKDYDNNCIPQVFQIVTKSKIDSVIFWNKDFDSNIEQIKLTKAIPNDILFDLIKRFDIKQLKQLKETNAAHLSEQEPNLYMQQAYICCFLHDYISAYYCVDNAAQSFYRKKEFVWYFIAICNKKKIGQIIVGDIIYRAQNSDTVQKINSEIEKIDLYDVFNSLPGLDSERYKYLKDLIDFRVSSATFYDAFAYYLKADEEAKTTYSLYAGVPAYENLSKSVWDYYQYCLYNYIFTQHFREDADIYNLFTRAIINSVCTPDKKNKIFSTEESLTNVHAEKLSMEEIHLIIRFMSPASLSKLLDEIGADIIPLSDEGYGYMQELADNLKEALNDDRKYDGIDRLYWNYISLASHITLSSEIVQKIIKTFASIKNVAIYQQHRNSIYSFLKSVFMQQMYYDSGICKNVKTIISNIIGFVSKDYGYIDYFQKLINALVAIIRESDDSYSSSTNVKKLLSKDYYSMLINIYPICTTSLKSTIQQELSKWHFANNNKDLKLYAKMLLHGLIDMNENAEQMAFMIIDKENKEQKDNRNRGIVIESGYTQIIEDYLDLFLNNMLIDSERFVELVEESDFAMGKWLIDIGNYDYSKFDINWLRGCSDSLLKTICSNETAKSNILRAYKDNYFQQFIDKRVSEIIIKYFI